MSFCREVNETCREEEQKLNYYSNIDIMMDEESSSKSNSNNSNINNNNDLFQSVDFDRFIGSDLFRAGRNSPNSDNIPKEAFLSKDSGLPSWNYEPVFNSREAFSDLLKSDEWDMKLSPPVSSNNSVGSITKEFPKKSFPSEEVKDELKTVLSSREWMPCGNLGSHVDVSYNGIFGATEDAADTPATLPVAPSPPKYDWNKDFFAQLQLVPPPIEAPAEPVVEEPEDAAEVAASAVMEPAAVEVKAEPSQAATVAKAPPKRKRKRKPRKKVLPEVFVFVEPVDADVLLGRGGRSNHHPGNKRYREEVKNLQNWYKGIDDKDEKTDLSQCLVDYVHSYGGRFLEPDKSDPTKPDRWYIVPNIVARRKASQALREDNDAEKRRAKRERHLAKKAAEEESKSNKKARKGG